MSQEFNYPIGYVFCVPGDSEIHVETGYHDIDDLIDDLFDLKSQYLDATEKNCWILELKGGIPFLHALPKEAFPQ